MTCPAALPLVYLSYSDCDLTKHSIPWFLATVFTQNDSITLSFSGVAVMPYFRVTIFGIIDMTCPAALPLVYLFYTDCDLTKPSISWVLATVFTQNDSLTLSFSSVTVMPYFRLTMLGIIDMTCPAALPLDYLSYSDCDLTMPSISWFLATVFIQTESLTQYSHSVFPVSRSCRTFA